MPGKVEHADGQLQVLGDAGMVQVESGLPEVVLHRVGGTLPLKGTDQPGKPGLHVGIKAERLAHFASGRAATIGNDVGAHGCPKLAVACIDVLDGTLAIVAGWQVKVDVGPFASYFA